MAAAIKAQSVKTGMSESAWVREILGKHLDLTDARNLQPVRRYGDRPTPDILAMTNLLGELRRQGGLFIQEAKAAREAGASFHPQLEALILEIDAAAKAVIAMRDSVLCQQSTRART